MKTESSRISIVYAPNMSVGVNLLFKLVREFHKFIVSVKLPSFS